MFQNIGEDDSFERVCRQIFEGISLDKFHLGMGESLTRNGYILSLQLDARYTGTGSAGYIIGQKAIPTTKI